MNVYVALSSLLCFVLGLAHSIIGEFMIFRDKRKAGKLVPTLGSGPWKPATIPILWATWHFASVLGWGFGVVLGKMAIEPSLINNPVNELIIQVIAGTMLVGGLLVLGSTRGRHPGWIVLFGIFALLMLA